MISSKKRRVTAPPGQNGRHFADDIFKCISVNEMFRVLMQFHWRLFLRIQLAIIQHWFRKWLLACSATSHYLNHCWPSSLTHVCGTRGYELIGTFVTNRYLIRIFSYIAADRLHDFLLGVRENSPGMTPFGEVHELILCSHYNGNAGSTTEFKCRIPGRYLVVQIPGSDQRLTLCEVEVFQISKLNNSKSYQAMMI